MNSGFCIIPGVECRIQGNIAQLVWEERVPHALESELLHHTLPNFIGDKVTETTAATITQAVRDDLYKLVEIGKLWRNVIGEWQFQSDRYARQGYDQNADHRGVSVNLHTLIGKTIHQVTILDGDLFFITDGGTYKAAPDGDCCANCYIQHLAYSEALAPGAVVTAIEDVELPPDPESDPDNDYVIDVWGHRIITTKGTCTIEMRVDHNGFYGGTLEVTQVTNTLGKVTKEGTKIIRKAFDTVHEDCALTPELGIECGCLTRVFGKPVEDF